MASTNVLNVGAPGFSTVSNTGASVQKSKELEEAAAVFAGMMNQELPDMGSSGNSGVTDKAEDTTISASETSVDTYEKYQYKDKEITEAKPEETIEERVEEVVDDVVEIQQEMMTKLEEELGISMEEIDAILSELGLNVLDLLDPQNLVAFMMQVNQTTNQADLLVNAEFQNLLSAFGEQSQEVATLLGVDVEDVPETLQQIVDSLETVMTEGEVTEMNVTDNPTAEVVVENETHHEEVVWDDVPVEETVEQPTQKEASLQEENVEQTKASETVEVDNQGATENQNMSNGDARQEFQMAREDQAVATATQTVTQTTGNETVVQTIESYLSADGSQIIEQIVEQVRVNVTPDVSSMQMQLNPENLGKIYLEIAAKDGAVTAHIATQNEVVKEAIEAQVVVLKETLSQAGVKVDAVEVTVGSHEFERNLEEHSKREENEGEYQEEISSHRRNINLSSLDELSGVMTEEEALVAQMMRDQGNSVDFTA